MTDEELKYLIAMQSRFPKDWKVGDLLYRYNPEGKIYIVTEYYAPEEHKSGRIYFRLPEWKARERSLFEWLPTTTKLYHIPRPFDTENPERGLWGMVDWDQLSDKFISTDGNFLIMKRRGEELHNIVDTPTLAILKALAAQWGVTV